MTTRLAHIFSLLTLSFFVAYQASADTQVVKVPVNFDYPLLRQLLVRQLFTQDGERAELLHDPTGCNQIVLSNPTIAPQSVKPKLVDTALVPQSAVSELTDTALVPQSAVSESSDPASVPQSSESESTDPASVPQSSESESADPASVPQSSESESADPASVPQSSESESTDPASVPRNAELELIAQVDVRLGINLMGRCRQLPAWQGGVGFLGQPLIGSDNTSIKIKTSAIWLIGADGNKIVSGRVWDAAKGSLNNFLNSFTLELSPYIDSLSGLLPEVLPQQSTQQLQAMISSLKLHDLQVNPTSLDASIGFTVDVMEIVEQPEVALTDQELLQWETRWQLMDSLLVMAVKRYASATSLQEVRNALLELLIDSRYRLRDVLTATPEYANAELRAWFLQSWQELRPLVRSIALEQPGQEHLLWLSLLTATDALDALDQLGPGIGLDISADGLRRMARMLNAGQPDQPLEYDEAVDPQLQQLLRQQSQSGEQDPSALYFNFSLFARAYAASPAQRLNTWVPKTSELDQYLPMVSTLLTASADKMLQQHRLEPDHKQLFKKLMLATAWQESCWRQYVMINNQMEPLRSSTGDVGLMQVNERVWRGFYDIQKLRWDIAYNSDTGAEILLDYLRKYALKRGEHKQAGGLPNLARASYSAYNGGPSQVSRYRRTNVAAVHRKVDEAFWEKYRQVEAGKELRVAQCLKQPKV